MDAAYVPFASGLTLIIVGQVLQLYLIREFTNQVKQVSKNTLTHEYVIPPRLSAGTLARRFSRDFDALQSVAISVAMGSAIFALVKSDSPLFGAAVAIMVLTPLLTFALILLLDVDRYAKISPFSISPVFILGAAVNLGFLIHALVH